MSRRIRLGMVGGGRDAFIGGVHRIASRVSTIATNWSPAPFPRRPRSRRRRRPISASQVDRAYGDFSRWRSARRG
jgi:hypothetical protein